MPCLTIEEFAAKYPDDVGKAPGVSELGRGGASSGVERFVENIQFERKSRRCKQHVFTLLQAYQSRRECVCRQAAEPNVSD